MAKKELTQAQRGPFEECYALYPTGRKKRGDDEQTWAKLSPDAETAAIIKDRIIAWNRYYKAVNYDRKYVRLFSTWLNKKGWKDDIPSATGEPNYSGPKKHICVTCDNEAPHARTQCYDCRKQYEQDPDFRRMVDQTLQSMGIEDENYQELINKCKEFVKTTGRGILKGKLVR